MAPVSQGRASARRDELLACFAAAVSREMAGDVAVVLAHPDDETIACGAQLARLDGVTVVVVTDGAPRNLVDARRCGFEKAEAYAARRSQELEVALSLAGIGPDQTVTLGIADQQPAFGMAGLARLIAAIFNQRDVAVAITHAFEGGHPDHDATALAVHAAAALLRRSGRELALIEVPLYHLGANGMVRQRFAGPGSGEVVVHLSETQQALKRAMCAAHRTQAGVLAGFALDIERFRPSVDYDFAQLPSGGRLLYERYDWGLDGDRWQRLAKAALDELGTGRPP